MQLTTRERQLVSRAVDLALEPGWDGRAAALALVELAEGDGRRLERAMRRVRLTAEPMGQLTQTVLAVLADALQLVRQEPQ